MLMTQFKNPYIEKQISFFKLNLKFCFHEAWFCAQNSWLKNCFRLVPARRTKSKHMDSNEAVFFYIRLLDIVI